MHTCTYYKIYIMIYEIRYNKLISSDYILLTYLTKPLSESLLNINVPDEAYFRDSFEYINVPDEVSFRESFEY
jgi:hypothetical protein